MKSFFFLIIALLFATAGIAQVPQGISYQAIAFNTSGAAVTNGNVGVKISILDNSASGTVVYSETHTKSTNAQGLFNLNIGQGSATIGAFSAINWGTNSKFLKVEIDPNGGSSYTITGSNQLMAVPYALTAGNIVSTSGTSLNDQIVENKSANFGFLDDYDGNAHVYNRVTGIWSSQSFSSNASPTLVGSNGNFGFVDDYDGKGYAYNSKTNTWSSQTFSSNAAPVIVTSNGNFGFVDDYSGNAYVYSSKTGTWSSQSFSSNAAPVMITSNGNFGFLDDYTGKAYVFNTKTATWSSQTFSSNAAPTMVTGGGNFGFVDSYDGVGYSYNAATGTWSAKAFSSNASPTMVVSETN